MSKIIQFPNPDDTVAEEHYITLRTNRKGELIEAGIWSGLDKETSHLLFVAAWWFLRHYGVMNPDDPDRVIALISVAKGSRVNVFSPPDEDEDAFVGKDRQEWLARRLKDAFELALPSSSVAGPASGTISPPHSANFGQLEFSW